MLSVLCCHIQYCTVHVVLRTGLQVLDVRFAGESIAFEISLQECLTQYVKYCKLYMYSLQTFAFIQLYSMAYTEL